MHSHHSTQRQLHSSHCGAGQHEANDGCCRDMAPGRGWYTIKAKGRGQGGGGGDKGGAVCQLVFPRGGGSWAEGWGRGLYPMPSRALLQALCLAVMPGPSQALCGHPILVHLAQLAPAGTFSGRAHVGCFAPVPCPNLRRHHINVTMKYVTQVFFAVNQVHCFLKVIPVHKKCVWGGGGGYVA